MQNNRVRKAPVIVLGAGVLGGLSKEQTRLVSDSPASCRIRQTHVGQMWVARALSSKVTSTADFLIKLQMPLIRSRPSLVWKSPTHVGCLHEAKGWLYLSKAWKAAVALPNLPRMLCESTRHSQAMSERKADSSTHDMHVGMHLRLTAQVVHGVENLRARNLKPHRPRKLMHGPKPPKIACATEDEPLITKS